MGFLDNLGGILGGATGSSQGKAPGGNNWLDVVGPGLLGALIGVILPGKSSGMLKIGGATALATMLWNKYKDRIVPPASTQNGTAADFTPMPLALADQAAVRLIRSIVFAAKSDGQIDEEEQKTINQRLTQLNLGPAVEQLVAQVANEPLDPQKVALGVADPQEAMALFMAACSVIKIDTFMENSYIDALAQALGVPEEMKKDLMK